MTSSIKTHSSHLFGLLSRAGVSPQALEKAFALSLERGGLFEIDFKREEGVSYNPRPARHCHILLSDCGVRDERTLEASLLASTWELNLFSTELFSFDADFPRSANLAEEAKQEQPVSANARLIRLAQLLDRARHVHLSKDPSKLEEVRQKVSFYLELGKLEPSWRLNDKLFSLLHAWLKRIEHRC